jgi:hypothetical protein
MSSTRRIREAAYSAATDEKRSFDEIYGDSKLFEDTDDLIDPKFKKLFESVYEDVTRPNYSRLREAKEEGFDWKAKAAEKSGDKDEKDPPKKGGKKKVTESLADRFLRLQEQDSHDVQSDPCKDDVEGIPCSLNSSPIGSGGQSGDITETPEGSVPTGEIFKESRRDSKKRVRESASYKNVTRELYAFGNATKDGAPETELDSLAREIAEKLQNDEYESYEDEDQILVEFYAIYKELRRWGREAQLAWKECKESFIDEFGIDE